MSRETTFEHDLDPQRDRDTLSRMLVDLCERVSGDLKRRGYMGKTIGVKLRYGNFRTVTRETTLEHATYEQQTIIGAARTCLKRVGLDRKLRLLGVRVGSLVRAGQEEQDSRLDRPSPEQSKAGESSRLFD